MKVRSFFLNSFGCGILSAQPAPRSHAVRGPMIQDLTVDLNLTADQQAQVKGIFQAQAGQSRAPGSKLRDQRTALAAAVKSGATDQIDKISGDMSQLQGQMAANRAKMLAKFYSILTPDQKAKVDPKIDAMFQRRRGA